MQKTFFLCPHCLEGTLVNNLGKAGTGGNNAILVMYCIKINVSLRIVTKSLYGTAPPFSILNGTQQQETSVQRYAGWVSILERLRK